MEVLYLGDGRIRAAVDRHVLEGGFASEGRNAWVSLEPSVWCLERPDTPDVDGALAGSDVIDGTSLTAPMPGTVVKVLVGEGDEVEEGQTLLVLEAMKMEQSVGPRTPARCGHCLTPWEHAFPAGRCWPSWRRAGKARHPIALRAP